MKSKVQPKREVKVIRVRHGIFGRANTRNIGRTIEKWGKKGFTLEQQNDQRGGCGGGGYTLLTFVQDDTSDRNVFQIERASAPLSIPAVPKSKKGLPRWVSIAVVGVFGVCAVVYAVSPHPPVSSRPVAAPAATATSASPATMTSIPVDTSIPPTLDATGMAIVATQAFFVSQQTQAAGNSAVVTPAPAEIDQAAIIAYPARTYYAQGSVNVRDCPRRDCSKIDYLVDGQSIAVTGELAGDAVRAGNPTWYRVDYDGHQGFVYSEFLTDQAPAAPPTQAPTQPFSVAPVQNAGSVYVCNGIDDLNCSDFPRDGIQAQNHLLQCGVDEDRLDGEKDGRACEFGSN